MQYNCHQHPSPILLHLPQLKLCIHWTLTPHSLLPVSPLQPPFYFVFMILATLLLSRFSHVRLCVTPQVAAHQAPPSPGFSRQEHWSGLPFPSPMHESEKWKWSRSDMSDSLRPYRLQPTRLLRPWDSPGTSTRVGCHCLLQEPHIRRIIYLFLWLAYFISIMFLQLMLKHVSKFPSFWTLNNISLYVCTTFSLPIHLSIDTWIASTFWLLWLMLLWTWVYKHQFNLFHIHIS